MVNKIVLKQLNSERKFRDIWIGVGIASYWAIVAHISYLTASHTTIEITGTYSIGVLTAFFAWAFFGAAVLNRFASLRPYIGARGISDHLS